MNMYEKAIAAGAKPDEIEKFLIEVIERHMQSPAHIAKSDQMQALARDVTDELKQETE